MQCIINLIEKIMKKLFVTAIMAIALIAGSATIYADNNCSTAKCPQQKVECTKSRTNCQQNTCTDCKACSDECKAAKCADCKCDKSACTKAKSECKHYKQQCKQAKPCNKK